jgi:LysR family glycine cleavage system transcriptional activator
MVLTMFSQLPSLNNLKAFAAAAHFNSFKVAAEALNVTPTAISHQIKHLEQFLNVLLFERQVRQVVLTAEGEKLAATTERMFSELSNTLTELTKPATQITVSCCTSFATLWLAPKLADFLQRYPDIDVQILASDSLQDFSAAAQLDIALRYGKGVNEGEILLATETQSCYQLSTNSQPSGRLFVTHWRESSALGNLPWQQYVGGLGFTIKSFEQEQYTLQAALAGQGMALISNVLAESVVKQGWLAKQDHMPEFAGYNYCLRLNPKREHNHRVRAFAHWLQQEFATLNAHTE